MRRERRRTRWGRDEEGQSCQHSRSQSGCDGACALWEDFGLTARFVAEMWWIYLVEERKKQVCSGPCCPWLSTLSDTGKDEAVGHWRGHQVISVSSRLAVGCPTQHKFPGNVRWQESIPEEENTQSWLKMLLAWAGVKVHCFGHTNLPCDSFPCCFLYHIERRLLRLVFEAHPHPPSLISLSCLGCQALPSLAGDPITQLLNPLTTSTLFSPKVPLILYN